MLQPRVVTITANRAFNCNAWHIKRNDLVNIHAVWKN